jgi:GH24 family phage-related lysozyme (muramidase)
MSKWAWCMVNDDDKLATGWNKIGDYWYYFWSNGSLATGWTEINDQYFYLNENGQMQTGWIQLDGKWYYLEEQSNGNKGVMYKNGTYTINGKLYTFNEDGSANETSLVSDALIDFVKSFEGFSATPYQDEVGVWTLGYGMTGNEIEGIESVTESEATQMLKDWINKKYAPVIKTDLDSKNITLTQNEFDALVSFAYNVGTAGVLGSTLYKNVVAGVKDSATITANFRAWSYAGGKLYQGLYRRRTDEANIFLNGDYTAN